MHENFIQRCLDLAGEGLGLTSPNPLVGCVIVVDGLILAEGYHHHYGGPHAERIALSKVQNRVIPDTAILYVNLEPCNHFGKTPPCTDLIIESGIKKVVIGTPDPNPLVSGSGIKRLQDAGIDVTVGICNDACEDINRRFFTLQRKNRPYIILKWAQSHDGFIDIIRKKNTPAEINWISSPLLRLLVHRWRTEEDAVLVGAATIITDDPLLTAREWKGKNPLRIVLDSKGYLPTAAKVFNDDALTMVFSTKEETLDHGDCSEWIKLPEQESLMEMLDILRQKGISSILVEGGSATLQSFINQGLWDEVRIITGDISFGNGVKAPEFEYPVSEIRRFGNENLRIMRKIR